jgi:hypothetical protein
MEINSLIQHLETKLTIANKIKHFDNLRETALTVLDAIPDSMVKTSKAYKKRVENYTEIINKLKISYQNLN